MRTYMHSALILDKARCNDIVTSIATTLGGLPMNKRTCLTLALLPLALCSCTKSGYLGVYSFQMGKNSGAHAIASMTLTNDDYLMEGDIVGKKMTLYGEVKASGGNSSISSSTESSTSTSEESTTYSDTLTAMLAKGISINGYYHIAKDLEGGKREFKIGFDLATLLKGVTEDPMPLDSEIIEKFIYSEIDDKKIYLHIPVSFEDLELQLYWYGMDFLWLSSLDDLIMGKMALPSFSLDNSEEESSESSAEESVSSQDSSSEGSTSEHVPFVPGTETLEHPTGSKPTVDDIAEINKTYPAAHNGEKYRSFYTISLALTRQ